MLKVLYKNITEMNQAYLKNHILSNNLIFINRKSNKNSRNFAWISPQPKLNNTNLNTKLAYKGIVI